MKIAKKITTLLFITSSLIAMEPVFVSKKEAPQIIDGINVIVPNFNPELKIETYNTDKSNREEQHINTQWINRMERVKAMIDSHEADIVCLQEMREIEGAPSDARFLSQFDQYRFVIGYRNPSFPSPAAPKETAFAQATLYNYKKMFPLQSFSKWLSDTPDVPSDTWAPNPATARGAMVLCTQFQLTYQGRIVKNTSPFWVFNVHFELGEEEKTKSCYKLLEIIDSVAKGQPYIVCGDFNFFPPNLIPTSRGKEQREILTQVMKDLGKDALTPSGRFIEGTFVGYEHDKFKADLNEIITRTDHIFGSQTVEKIGEALVDTRTMRDPEPQELTTRDLPSDHLPLIVTVTLFGRQ